MKRPYSLPPSPSSKYLICCVTVLHDAVQKNPLVCSMHVSPDHPLSRPFPPRVKMYRSVIVWGHGSKYTLLYKPQ